MEDLIQAACDTASEKCLESVTSNAKLIANANDNIIILQRKDINTDEIIEKIDKRRLGLQPRSPDFRPQQAAVPVEASFRKVSIGSVEGYANYINRLLFLKNWSEFLIKNQVSSSKQKQVQTAFENFQYSFNSAYSDFVDILITDMFKDSTDQQANLVNSKNLQSFLDNNTFSLRIKRAESALKAKTESILGPNLNKIFINSLWLGGFKFGMCQPMINKQVAVRTDR